ncbi:MAG TPA: molybdopterin cofactor-binding domain-containing protein [Stellaceae bacterium]
MLGFHVGAFRPFTPEAEAATASPGASSALAPNVYLSIDRTGAVTIVAHRSEMGTGIRTGLPMVLAGELEADWRRVTVHQATGDKKFGDQNTDGSRSVRQFYGPMREAGAAARQMLEAAAARTWKVPAGECRARNHEVVHGPTARRLGFGALVSVAATLPVPSGDRLRLKARTERRYIGTPLPIVDLGDIIHGRAIYGMDVVLPEMRHASIERCPVYGGRVRSFDAKDALAVPGVEQVVEIEAAPMPARFRPLGGVAVIANSTWAAQQGRQRLEIDWDLGPNASYDSTAYRTELETTARQPGRVVRNNGDVDGAMASAAKHSTAEYYVPHLAHAAMEPLVAMARMTGDGKCEVWAPTQNPQAARSTVAEVLKLDEADVTINVTLLGGGFGRKSKPDHGAEAAVLSQKIGAPVKVTWTREDDIQHDYYHAVCAQHFEAALDSGGRPAAWLHRTVFPPIGSTFTADTTSGSASELQQGVVDMPYAIPNERCENDPSTAHARIGWYRSVYNIPHAFGVCSFADELAAAAGRDPFEFLVELIGPPRTIDLKVMGVDYPNYGASTDLYPIETGRLLNVLKTAATAGEWVWKVPDRHGLGIAVHRSFLSYVAVVVEVALGEDGKVQVPRVDLAADCGLMVNPDRVRAQMEGAVMMAIGNTLYGAITFREGRTEQSNFTDYLVARMDDVPDTRVHLIASEAPPAGVGEPGVPPMAPAICNAIYAATGKRVRSLPVGDLSKL